MNFKKDTDKEIDKEIERYLKYNYAKKDIITRLLNDGFSESEINDKIENAPFSGSYSENENIILFFPTIIILILLSIRLVVGVFQNIEIAPKILCLALSTIIITLTVGYFKGNILAVKIVIALLSIIVLWIFISMLSQLFDFHFHLAYPYQFKFPAIVLLVWFISNNISYHSSISEED
ncbi:MAG: hypothetical protein EOO46_10855 [Flavobacterium sp.]|nr:MAG: hypothetical protein EOO46_10855 [Flavobacterium sp.]